MKGYRIQVSNRKKKFNEREEKIMNKKTAAMVLCTVMAAGVLTGCGGAEEKKDGKTTIKYAA